MWLGGLLAVALLAQVTIAAHLARTRGLPHGFPAPVAEADVPILGVNVALEQHNSETLDAALARIAEGGFTWVRQSFYWSQIEPQAGDFDWTAPDRILAALARYPQLRLVAVLEDAPPVPPSDPDRFAAFAGAFAARYGGQVDYYQVWDEPNLADRWGGGPVSPPAYADLLARTARAIRAADPDARILLASLAPTTEAGPQNLSDVRYLEQLYQAGAAPYFDVACGKPYGFYTGPDDRRTDESVLNFSRLLLLREVMVEHGDANKTLWASHWGWNALPPAWAGAPSVWGQTDEATQAAYTVAALARARTEWPWVGAMMLEHFQPAAPADDPRWGFALVGPDEEPRPVYDAVAAWAAALPDAAPIGGYPADNPWTTYEGEWRVGTLGADVAASVRADGDRVAFRFAGPSVALTVRRGPYRAFLYVTVDGRPANALPRDGAGRAYIALYDDETTLATVPLATGLSSGPHTVEVLAEGGQGQWALVDWRVGAEPSRAELSRNGLGWQIAGLTIVGAILAVLLVRDAQRMAWSMLRNAFLRRPELVQVMLITGMTGALWIAAGNSWGISLTSPWFIVSLLTLPVLVMLFAWRLDLGLALIALCAPFYLHPGNMLYRALGMPEVLVLLCGLGAILQRRRGVRRLQEKSLCSEQEISPQSTRRAQRFPEFLRGLCGLRGEYPVRFKLTYLDWTVVLLMTAATVAGLAATDKVAALFELRAVFLLPALYYALLRAARLHSQARWRIADGLVLGAVGVAAIGLVQYVTGRNVTLAEGGLPRLQSVYPSPNNVGLYLGRVWPLLVAVALWATQKRRRMLYALALVPVTLALVLSFSRGALLLGIPAALLVIGWCAGGRWRWAALALVIIGALALIPLLRVPRFASLLDLQRGSTFFRLELWRSSLQMIREHPWFGVGPGNFAGAYRTRYILPTAWAEPNLEHPHNVYLDHWTRLGVLGLLVGIGIQAAFWRATWRAMRRRPRCNALALGLAGSIAALMGHGLVDNTLFFTDLALTFFLTLALAQERSTN